MYSHYDIQLIYFYFYIHAVLFSPPPSLRPSPFTFNKLLFRMPGDQKQKTSDTHTPFHLSPANPTQWKQFTHLHRFGLELVPFWRRYNRRLDQPSTVSPSGFVDLLTSFQCNHYTASLSLSFSFFPKLTIMWSVSGFC